MTQLKLTNYTKKFQELKEQQKPLIIKLNRCRTIGSRKKVYAQIQEIEKKIYMLEK